MRFAVALAVACLAAAPVAAQEAAPAVDIDLVPVPSGIEVRLVEVVRDIAGTEGLTYRFRFLAPQIADETLSLDAVAGDMLHLCEAYAVPHVTAAQPQPNQIVISIADRDIPFGTYDDQAVQVFEGYSFDAEGHCTVEFY